MMSKPRYWRVAFPLTITSLCVAPQVFFLKHWVSCFETSITKLKVCHILNGPSYLPHNQVGETFSSYGYEWNSTPHLDIPLSLPGVPLYHCHETRHTHETFFSAKQLSAFHPDDQFDLLTYVVHFILSRHFDVGRDLCLELLQESNIATLPRGGGPGLLSPDRITIAVQATLLSFQLMEKENGIPAWPSTSDFSIVPPNLIIPPCSTVLPSSLASKSLIQEYVNRMGTTLNHIASICDHNVGNMSVLEDQYSYSRVNLSFEESSNYIIRKHDDSYVIAIRSITHPKLTSYKHVILHGRGVYIHPSH